MCLNVWVFNLKYYGILHHHIGYLLTIFSTSDSDTTLGQFGFD